MLSARANEAGPPAFSIAFLRIESMLHSVSIPYPHVKQNLRIPFTGGIPIMLGMSLGDQIKKARTALGISQTAIAKQFGISRAAVAQWENGTTRPDSDKLVELAAILKISLATMLDGDEDAISQVREPQDELMKALELLTQEQRSDFLAQIQKTAATNKAIMEQLAPQDVIKRTVNVQERRRQMHPNLPFADRRNKHA